MPIVAFSCKLYGDLTQKAWVTIKHCMTTYADRPWLNHYDASVPHSLEYPDIPVHTLLETTAQNFPGYTAALTSVRLPLLGTRSETISYQQLGVLSDRFAAGLADMGINKGDRVAIISINCVQFIIAFFGVLKAGAVVVAIDPTFPVAKMADHCQRSGVKAAFTLTLFYDQVCEVRAECDLTQIIVSNIKEFFPKLGKMAFTLLREKKDGHYIESLQPGDIWLDDIFARYSPGQRPHIEIDPQSDTAIFQFTGGTSGTPKPACGPHFALVANATQMRHWMSQDEASSDSFLAAIPFFHVYGLIAVMLFAVSMASPMIMVFDPRNMTDVLQKIQDHKPTLFMGVPALFNKLNKHPDVLKGKYSLKSIRACVSGSAPLPMEVKRRFEELSGGRLMEGYGMSETPTATHCNPYRGENRAGSIGLPFPDIECRIVDIDDDTIDVPVGETGELLMRGPMLMTHYHNAPEESAGALKDGWLHTGDIARMDEDGFFYIVDRKKDMVLIGGFNVYPAMVEKTLIEHPAVIDAGVAGIPHPRNPGQEAIKAWIVKDANTNLTTDNIIEFCSQKLAYYEVPRRIEFVDSLPRTIVGKLLRRVLVAAEAQKDTAAK